MTAAGRATPLALLLPFTLLNSIACGTVTSGIFFISKQGYGFTDVQNFGLGLVQGLAYVCGALLAGRVRLATTRRTLLALLLGLGLLCGLPALWHGPGALWALLGLYSPLNGMLWPIVESYVSGGRRERALRAAIGVWSVTWSGALVLAFLAISPWCEGYPREVLLALGGLHLLSAGFAVRLPAEPAAHAHEFHPHPPSYEELLQVFRWLLPVTTLLLNALAPLLPSVFRRLAVPDAWASALTVAWLLPRAIAFCWLSAHERWHGSWRTPRLGGTCLLVGFVLTIASGACGPGPAGITVVLVGLVLYGLGMAIVYQGALYYAMEVGKAEIGAGGAHEALIGAGFAAGPLLGLIALAVFPGQDLAVAGLAGTCSAAIVVVAFARARATSRAGGRTPR